MALQSSKKVIYAALAGNGLIAITKFIAAALTGSSAMLSEAIHSVVDTGNQGLLLYGMKRANRPADDTHPFGYSMELYFWTFLVAILIFAIGAGISIYEGVNKLITPHSTTDPYINYIVLAVAMVFEGAAWSVAFKEFRKTKGKYGYFEAVHFSKDPTVFTVLFEDTAAMLGLIVAFLGIFLGEIFADPLFDALASIVIGLILAATAALLAYECKGLLIGEGMRPETIEKIKASAMRTPGVERVNEALTMYLGPRDVLLTISLDFDDSLSAGAVEFAISALEDSIRAEWPDIRKIFVEAQSWSAHLRSQKNLETDGGESS